MAIIHVCDICKKNLDNISKRQSKELNTFCYTNGLYNITVKSTVTAMDEYGDVSPIEVCTKCISDIINNLDPHLNTKQK